MGAARVPVALVAGLDAPMKARYDVVVVGAGPAGGVTAFTAARRGLEVLLLDRAVFPRFKVCGCCLNARALNTLERVGLADVVVELGAARLDRLDVRGPEGSASLALSGSVSLSRSRLDHALVERARLAGATFRDGVAARLGTLSGPCRRVQLQTRAGETSEVRADVVVVADGIGGSALRGQPELEAHVARGSRIGAGTVVANAPPAYEPGVVMLACGRRGYAGTVRLEDHRLDVAAALDPDFVAECRGPGPAVARVLEESGLPAIPGLLESVWRGTPALTRQRPGVAGDRFFVLGDAAGYVEPFTGEGIAWAVEGAAALGELMPRAVNRWDDALAAIWARRHRSLVRRRQLGCRAVSALLRRPRLLHGAIKLVGRSPGVVAPLVRRLTQPLSG